MSYTIDVAEQNGFNGALLDHVCPFPPSPEQSVEDWLQCIPSRWAVALLLDENQRPIQLICLRDLREGLRHRLEETEPGQAATRKVKLRELVRLVRWQEVHGDFEADACYQSAARQFYPEMYRELMRPNQAWFIHVDPDAKFPRYVKTTDIDSPSGYVFGPLADKHAAARLIEWVEDAFDLCRYPHILAQYPDGKACAYKEMGRCPAPCDGSISIEQYRRMVEESVAGLTNPQTLIEQHTRRMEEAAAEMRFEIAAKIRAFVMQLAQLREGAFKHARPLTEFGFVTLQPAPAVKRGIARQRAAGCPAKIFIILPGKIEQVLSLTGLPGLDPRESFTEVVSAIRRAVNNAKPDARAEIVGLTARHLMAGGPGGGVFIPLDRLDENSLTDACRRLSRNRPAVADKKRGDSGAAAMTEVEKPPDGAEA